MKKSQKLSFPPWLDREFQEFSLPFVTEEQKKETPPEKSIFASTPILTAELWVWHCAKVLLQDSNRSTDSYFSALPTVCRFSNKILGCTTSLKCFSSVMVNNTKRCCLPALCCQGIYIVLAFYWSSAIEICKKYCFLLQTTASFAVTVNARAS